MAKTLFLNAESKRINHNKSQTPHPSLIDRLPRSQVLVCNIRIQRMLAYALLLSKERGKSWREYAILLAFHRSKNRTEGCTPDDVWFFVIRLLYSDCHRNAAPIRCQARQTYTIRLFLHSICVCQTSLCKQFHFSMR